MTITVTEEELRQRYLDDLINTATPVQRLLMLFDALQADLAKAEAAFGERDWKAVNDRLVHAQHILFALRDPLDRDSQLGTTLSGLYSFCLEQLIQCNLYKSPEVLGPVRQIVARVAAANRQAARVSAAAPSGGFSASA